ncbi:MAG: hypothetical protein K6L75_02690 [Cellvibrionaceae bacterium]
MRRHLQLKNLKFFILIYFVVQFSAVSHADEEYSRLDSLISVAGLVFQGTVVEKTSRLTEGEGPPMPYTFITYKVDRVFKGAIDGDTFILRFAGGQINESEFLTSFDFPLMDKGDTDILLVADNNVSDCPLVACSEGRYRYVDGLMFNEAGKTILVNEQGELTTGPAVDLKEFNTYQASETISLSYTNDLLEGEEIYSTVDEYRNLETIEGTSLDIATFGVIVEDSVIKVSNLEGYQQPPPEISADPNQAIHQNAEEVVGTVPVSPDFTLEDFAFEDSTESSGVNNDDTLQAQTSLSVIPAKIDIQEVTKNKPAIQYPVSTTKPKSSGFGTYFIVLLGLIIFSLTLLIGFKKHIKNKALN